MTQILLRQSTCNAFTSITSNIGQYHIKLVISIIFVQSWTLIICNCSSFITGYLFPVKTETTDMMLESLGGKVLKADYINTNMAVKNLRDDQLKGQNIYSLPVDDLELPPNDLDPLSSVSLISSLMRSFALLIASADPESSMVVSPYESLSRWTYKQNFMHTFGISLSQCQLEMCPQDIDAQTFPPISLPHILFLEL